VTGATRICSMVGAVYHLTAALWSADSNYAPSSLTVAAAAYDDVKSRKSDVFEKLFRKKDRRRKSTLGRRLTEPAAAGGHVLLAAAVRFTVQKRARTAAITANRTSRASSISARRSKAPVSKAATPQLCHHTASPSS
jgi:hypothetical protein